MRAIVIDRFGGPEELVLRDLAEPEPRDGEIRVRVVAAAVNPVDLKTRAGAYAKNMGAIPFPMILGWDLAGVVDAIGPGVTGHSVGERVVAMSAQVGTGRGTYAERVVLPAELCAAAPRGTGGDLATAAALPLAAVTALQGLRTLGLAPGQTLLVTGGVGAVGGFALQLAAHAGVQTIALVAGKDADLAARLGAGRVLVRESGATAPPLPRGEVDGVFDTVGAGASIAAARDGGRYITTVGGTLPRAEREIVPEEFSVTENGVDLTVASGLVDAGVLTLRIARELPFDAGQEAHRLLAAGGLGGKILLCL